MADPGIQMMLSEGGAHYQEHSIQGGGRESSGHGDELLND